ncbi:ParA family protein [Methylobacterium sp. V23]|uniref:ParA family protein n=1 Tax=Methylobacterium sp. V23 TaxID=2044878 RepID=UPI000CDA68F2|nr:ParA family protein [Methylobacterium sp. V23]POR40169.1 chromosome partitioning protein ParA [Methylobacterium sp. V23]
MQIVSVVQQKGGVGKTTLAINLAGELSRRGMRVAVVDADPQASAVAWAAPRKLGFAVKQELLSSGTVSQWLRNVLKQSSDVVVVDTPAGLGTVFRAAVDVADVILIPCGPSSLDINAARNTLASVSSMLRADARSEARVLMVPTRVDVQTPEGQQITDELGALGESISPAMSHDIYFVRAFTQGVSVSVGAPASKAAAEMQVLADLVLQQLGKAVA